MSRLVNVPREKDKGVVVEAEVDGNDVILWRREKSTDNSSKMATFYIGQHMLMADNHQQLLEMIGRDMAAIVIEARDAGYKHAQYDMRKALGL